MKKNHSVRKIFYLLLVFTMIMAVPINVSAQFSDVPANASYADALNRLTDLGIISAGSSFKPNDMLTREQFTKVIVVAAGLQDAAAAQLGSTVFPDIKPKAWSSGYINEAVQKGYITGMTDGKFHPSDNITFAQVCTVLVKALGYTDQDVPGMWPSNYIAKAQALGLSDGIKISTNSGVPRWAIAEMIDRLLETNVKSVNQGAPAQTFINATGYYMQCIVYGDSKTLDTLSAGQVLTDKGTFNNPSNLPFELGSENYLVINNGNIIKAADSSSILQVSVEQATDNRIGYKDGSGNDTSMVLPDNITYYYKGQKIDYSKILPLIQKNSSIVFNYNNDKTGYDFAVVFDPVYSKPEIADNFVPSLGRIGSIIFGSNPFILKDGNTISLSQIEDKDIVYQVSDIWGNNGYFLVMDKKIGGKITDIQPNNLSPRTLQIDGVNYDFSNDIDIGKLTGSYGQFTIGNNIIVSLGYDSKIVNIETFGTEDNSGYAVVLNNSYTATTNLDGTKHYTYSAKLLFDSGLVSTYNVTDNAAEMKGKLVNYKFVDSQTVSLEQISYNFPTVGSINKDEHMLGTTYVADNVKIFNVVFNDTNSDVQANILSWNDMPSGTIPSTKVWYTNTAGPFNDVNMIFTDDIFNQREQVGVVKAITTTPTAKGSSFNYTIGIGGKDYKYGNYIANSVVGSVCDIKMSSSGIDTVDQSILPAVSGTNVQALDSRRIKINNAIYFFNNGVSVYYMDSNGVVTLKTLADIDTNQTYGKIDLYIDSANASKVDVIMITE